MKVLALVLFAVAVAQARSTPVNSRDLALPGQTRWVVHLRVADSNSGLLNSCIGSVISNVWVLTSASCINDARFVWVRYGASVVIQPELVMETTLVYPHPSADIGIISLLEPIQFTATIAPIPLAGVDDEVPKSGALCTYGAEKDGGPGKDLKCLTIGVTEDLLTSSEDILTSSDAAATTYDLGAPLVDDGKQVAVLVGVPSDESNVTTFLKVSGFLDWIAVRHPVKVVNQGEGSKVIVVDQA